jgi:hypothetical protein
LKEIKMRVRTIVAAALSVIALPLFVSQASAGPANRECQAISGMGVSGASAAADASPWFSDDSVSTTYTAATNFDRRSFRTVTDCLNAAARWHVSLDRCER